MLDEMLACEENLETLRAALQAEFDADPPRFWRTYGLPLVPREAVLALTPKVPSEDHMMYLAAVEMVAQAHRERAEKRALEGKVDRSYGN
jgi:hypothetical protein